MVILNNKDNVVFEHKLKPPIKGEDAYFIIPYEDQY